MAHHCPWIGAMGSHVCMYSLTSGCSKLYWSISMVILFPGQNFSMRMWEKSWDFWGGSRIRKSHARIFLGWVFFRMFQGNAWFFMLLWNTVIPKITWVVDFNPYIRQITRIFVLVAQVNMIVKPLDAMNCIPIGDPMVIEPKYYAFWRWLDTRRSSSENMKIDSWGM